MARLKDTYFIEDVDAEYLSDAMFNDSGRYLLVHVLITLWPSATTTQILKKSKQLLHTGSDYTA